jgi:hypothetical protein
LRSLEELPPVDIDAVGPVELALPIATQAVQPTGEANVTEYAAGTAGDDAANDDDESENVSVP